MRILFTLLIGISTTSCLSQTTEKETAPPATNNAVTNSVEIPVVTNSVSEEKVNKPAIKSKADYDSTAVLQEIETETIDREGRVKSESTTKSSSQKYKSDSYYSSPAPSTAKKEASAVSTEALSRGFTTTKQQSSYQRTQRTPSVDQQAKMDETVRYFEQYAPESFEYHYYKYVAGNYSVELVNHLLKAYELKPNNADVQIQLAAYYFITGDTLNTTLFLNTIKALNRITDDITNYANDLLLSVPQNGTLITHGFDDTYSCLYLQSVRHIRPDVQLISLDFLQSEAFRASLKEKGYVMPQSTVIDVNYLTSFCSGNESKKLALSLTTPKEYFLPIEQKIYVVGLLFEYHSDSFNNFSRNETLWNEVLEKKLVNSSLNEKSKQLSSNYLPMLLQLRAVYLQQNNAEKVKEIDEALDKVSVQCKKYDQVQKIKKSY